MHTRSVIARSWFMATLCIGWSALPAAEKPALPAPNPLQPTQSWQSRAADRARLLSQVKWTPVSDSMPNRAGGFFEKGKENTGVPYSSVKSEGRYIGFDIGLRTFLAAVENPLSVLYTKSLAGKVPNAASYYGTVCSSFTSYALQCGIPEVSRRHGPDISVGVVLVEPQSVQAAQVGDIIYTPHATETSGSHVEMITAVTRDDRGRAVSVRVEESRPPTTRTTHRSAADFNAHLAARNKQLFRITDLDLWRGANRAESLRYPNYQTDAKRPAINRALLLDLGDWVPYQKGQAVKINVMDRDALGVKALIIQRGGKPVEKISLNGPGVIERTFTTCGDYTAHIVFQNGSPSAACEFAVCDLDVRLPAPSVSLAAEWTVQFNSTNMDVIALYLSSESDTYGRHSLFVSEEQRRLGAITVPAGLLKKEGPLQVWLIGEHRLGRLKVRKDLSLTAAKP